MSFQPVVVGVGLGAWSFLKATQESQRTAHKADAVSQREDQYFRETIGSIDTAADLVSDRRLLSIALQAFGLSNDLQNTFFLQKILEEGTQDTGALANRLADSRYTAFSQAFGFGDSPTPRTKLSGFATEILTRAQEQRFEEAVGVQDDTLRQALYFERQMPELAQGASSDSSRWFKLMGDRPLRTVMEQALGLPQSFGRLDIDKQLEMFRDKAEQRFGSSDIDVLAQPEVMENIVRTFLLRQQVSQSLNVSSASIALTLLQS
ncbi:MAG: DUF1217 domain-containing protein [Rhodobacteraceae bacterium]|nr:DUF1217 domain-containing protein [Paracoccaceae bacterium]